MPSPRSGERPEFLTSGASSETCLESDASHDATHPRDGRASMVLAEGTPERHARSVTLRELFFSFPPHPPFISLHAQDLAYLDRHREIDGSEAELVCSSSVQRRWQQQEHDAWRDARFSDVATVGVRGRRQGFGGGEHRSAWARAVWSAPSNMDIYALAASQARWLVSAGLRGAASK